MEWHYNDGGRRRYYKARNVRDCVTRAIAIANDMDYQVVYKDLFAINKSRGIKESPRNGVYESVYSQYLRELGWTKVEVKKGNQIHMSKSDLPSGTVICKIKGHLATVVDGALYDTWDSSKNDTAEVLKYWTKEKYSGKN